MKKLCFFFKINWSSSTKTKSNQFWNFIMFTINCVQFNFCHQSVLLKLYCTKKTGKNIVWCLSKFDKFFNFWKILHFFRQKFQLNVKCVREIDQKKNKNWWPQKIFWYIFDGFLTWEKSSLFTVRFCLCYKIKSSYEIKKKFYEFEFNSVYSVDDDLRLELYILRSIQQLLQEYFRSKSFAYHVPSLSLDPHIPSNS